MNGDILDIRNKGDSEAMSDEAVARACGSRDPTAIGILFDRFQPHVTRYVSRLVGSAADVEDLVQSTFLEVARGRALYDETRGSVKTWLFGIATNTVRHHRRSFSRRRRLALAVSEVPVAPPDLEATVARRRRVEASRRAFEALKVPYQEAFVLCALEGLSAREAARILGTSEGAIWKRVSKARAILRRAIEEGTV